MEILPNTFQKDYLRDLGCYTALYFIDLLYSLDKYLYLQLDLNLMIFEKSNSHI